MDKLFCISITKYCTDKDFNVFYPASMDKPKNNSVMFLTKKFGHKINNLLNIKDSLIYIHDSLNIPNEVSRNNVFLPVSDPRLEYCRFFYENNITNLPPQEDYDFTKGAFISKTAQVDSSVIVMPGAYISGQTIIGAGSYIGAGTKLIGRITIGKSVQIRENTVIGADALSTDRDANGEAITMPQFGGVIIKDNVRIGSNSVIARGAIDDTIIEEGCRLDNCSYISHNVILGRHTYIIGGTVMFGSSQTGERVYVSGNSTIRNNILIGNDSSVGMGAVVTRSVKDRTTVFGNPAKRLPLI